MNVGAVATVKGDSNKGLMEPLTSIEDGPDTDLFTEEQNLDGGRTDDSSSSSLQSLHDVKTRVSHIRLITLSSYWFGSSAFASSLVSTLVFS